MLNFFLTFVAAGLITPIVIWWYRKKNWVEDPKLIKHVKVTHQSPVPRGGGVVIFLSVCLVALVTLHVDRYLISILVGAAILTLIGILDDIYNLHPFWRLGIGVLVAVIVVGSGIGIPYVTNPLGSGVIRLDQPQLHFQFLGSLHTVWVLADLLAIFFIVWCMNIVNWSKGVDGQMPGFVAIALIFVGLLSERFLDDPAQFNTAYLSFIVAGAFVGFLIWNFYPQKILPGYGAGSLAGFFLAVLSILSGAKIATIFMVLAIPTADAVFTILRRLLAGKSPFWGDRGHLHHKLMDVLGWGRRRIAVFYWLSTLIMGMLALYLNTIGKLVTMILVLGTVFGFLIWAKVQTTRQNEKSVAK